jgi:rod shape-determining protein MreB
MSRDIAIDLGTANVLVYMKGRGVIINEPSVVAIDTANNNTLAVGNEAKRLVGRTGSNIRAIRPLKDGVIADIATAEVMLKYFIKRSTTSRFFKPRVVICVPSGITSLERRAIYESVYASGVREIYLLEEAMAAAIGVGLAINEPIGNMIVDIGGGTTEIAIISFGGIVISRSCNIAGDEFDMDIMQYMRRNYSIIVGEHTVELIKKSIGTAIKLENPEENEDEATYVAKGRNISNGLPKTVTLRRSELYDAMNMSITRIITEVHDMLDECPPELSGDILDNGIVLTGGGALLHGLDKRLEEELKIGVKVAENPLFSIANGAGKCIDEFNHFFNLLKLDSRKF